jgi:hypothetical protein
MRWYNVKPEPYGFVRESEFRYHEYGNTFVWIDIRDARDLGYIDPRQEWTSP